MWVTQYLTCFIFSILFCSCDKNKILPDPDPCLIQPCDTVKLLGILDTIWAAKIVDEFSDVTNNGIFEHDQNILLSCANSTTGFVTSYSKLDGSRNWIWNDIASHSFTKAHLIPQIDQLTVQYREKIGSIDVNSGSSKINYYHENEIAAHSFGQILGDFYYFTIRTKNDSLATLIRSHVEDLQTWDTVYTLKRGAGTGNSRPNIESYNLWVDQATGDSVLIFQHRMAFPNRVDVLAWNMTKKQVEWRHDDLTKLGNSNHQQIFLHDNKAYFAGGTAFYCFDMKTGEIVWQYDHPSGVNAFMYYKTVYAHNENLLIVRDGGESLYAFNPESGDITWRQSSAGPSSVGSGSPSYSNGIIYYTMDGKLWAIRASDGEVLWSEESKLHHNSIFKGDVAIDKDKEILYATDSYYLIAIKTYQE